MASMKQGVSDSAVDPDAGSRATGRVSLTAAGVSKSYGPVQALRPVDFELRRGEVHALVGENGSGKSTLVGILSGVTEPDDGQVRVGDSVLAHRPWSAQRAGVLTVFQDGSIIPDLTIAQNLYLGTPPARRPAYRRLASWATERLREYDLERLDPQARARTISPADRQLLEITRAMMSEPDVLLLDESTSALDAAGVDVALDLMRRAALTGSTVLFVTHRLSEVFRVADRVSVLRDGEWQGTHNADHLSTATLVELMAGAAVDTEFPPRAAQGSLGAPVLVADAVTGVGFGPVSIGVRPGEIVGIAGADNNGQLALLRALGGVDPSQGSLTMNAKPLTSLRSGLRAKVAFLSSDRRTESLFPSLPIRENLVAGQLSELSTAGFVRPRREVRASRASVDRFGIRLGSVEDPVTSLSGGNQQKVALSRLLVTKPDVILIDEPTQGVDVRSRMDIYGMLRDAANEGAAVVAVSSDASELAGLCDRIIVMSRGIVVQEIDGGVATEERIVDAFATVEQVRKIESVSDDVELEAPRPKWREFVSRYQDGGRLGLLAVLLVVLSIYVRSQNDSFFSSASIYNVLLTALPLAVVAAAQFTVLFTGGIDVSVGGTIGVTVAIASFWVQKAGLTGALLICLAISVGLGLVVGLLNANLAERARISPVIVTIATLGVLQGIGLKLRPTAGGAVSPALISALTKQVGGIPVALIVVAVLFVAGDVLLRSSGRGLRLRAVGLNAQFAYRLGENAPRLRQASYITCAALAAVAGVFVAAQVGTGDSTVGSQYTLLAIAAPIVGGASLLGGRGTFVGCLLGAVLLSLANAIPAVLSLTDGAGYLLTGGLTLLALLIYTSGVGGQVLTYARSARLVLAGRRSRS